MTVQPLGRHALLDLYDCDPARLDDLELLRSVFLKTAEELRCTLVQECFHRYAPQGVSGVLVIAESHLSVHTWPEHGYAAVDLFTCGDPSQLERMPKLLGEALGAGRYELSLHDRGRLDVKAKGLVSA